MNGGLESARNRVESNRNCLQRNGAALAYERALTVCATCVCVGVISLRGSCGVRWERSALAAAVSAPGAPQQRPRTAAHTTRRRPVLYYTLSYARRLALSLCLSLLSLWVMSSARRCCPSADDDDYAVFYDVAR